MGVKAVRIEVRFLIDDVLLKLDVRCKKKMGNIRYAFKAQPDAFCAKRRKSERDKREIRERARDKREIREREREREERE